ncbi:hypothetical protein H6F95_03960 [Cyanobacteria bacterium FACHB-471]|nr:hypothetical protein [Cyanobacteria bacterium FACHB-471]
MSPKKIVLVARVVSVQLKSDRSREGIEAKDGAAPESVSVFMRQTLLAVDTSNNTEAISRNHG